MNLLGTILWLRRRLAIRELASLAGALNLAAGIALMLVVYRRSLGPAVVALGERREDIARVLNSG